MVRPSRGWQGYMLDNAFGAMQTGAGVVAGIYNGMEYGMERVRGKRDWKNALLGGALTGALLTFGERLNQGWQIYWAYLKRQSALS
ncbi:hypothetical protein L7F22_030978 [Adiantum nelumboides]|nr:hypothetical protein [Adiantum nelumboides]